VDPARLEPVIERIYDAGLDMAQWPAVLEEIRRLLGSPAANLHIQLGSQCAKYVAGGYDEALVQLYKAHLFRQDPWAKCLSFPAGTVRLTPEFVPEGDLVRSPYYNEFLRPQGLHDGVVALMASIDEGHAAGLGIHRNRRGSDWGPEEIAVLRALIPHLRRAYAINRRIASIETARLRLDATMDHLPFGVVLLDERARITYANRVASSIAAARDGLVFGPGAAITATGRDDALRLREAIRAELAPRDPAGPAPPERAMTLARPSGKRPLQLEVVNLRDRDLPVSADGSASAVAVFVADPERAAEPRAAVLRQLYRLTPQETEVALSVARGRVPKETARDLGITCATVRQHLRSIYVKTGVDRQAALVKLLMAGVKGW